MSNLIDIDILLDSPLFAYPRLVMRAFNSFCGFKTIRRAKASFGREHNSSKRTSGPIGPQENQKRAALFPDRSQTVRFSLVPIARQSQNILPAALN